MPFSASIWARPSKASAGQKTPSAASSKPWPSKLIWRRPISVSAISGCKRRDFAEAENHYRKAVSLRPDFAGAHNNLGNVFREQRRFQEAEACFRLALSIDPSDAEAHNNVGIALADQDRFDEAIASYRQALQINPGYADAQKNMGLAFLKAGNAQMKCRKFTEALEIFDWQLGSTPIAPRHTTTSAALCAIWKGLRKPLSLSAKPSSCVPILPKLT